MRGLAALAVVLFHAHEILGWQPAPGGYLAVDLFFGLSGAVIANAYAPRLAAGLSVRGFLGRRLLRFLPLHLLGLAAGVTFAAALLAAGSPGAMSPGSIAIATALGLCFVPSLLTHAMFPLNVPAWSLLYELLANVGFAHLHPRITPRGLRAAAAALGVLLGIALGLHGDADAGMTLDDAPLAALRTAFAFVVGVAWVTPGALDPRRTPRLPLPLAMTIALVPMTLPVTGAARTALDLLTVLLLYPWVTSALLREDPAGDSGTLVHRTGAALGDASFGVYALHWPLLWLWNGFARRLDVDPRPGVWVGIVLLIMVCAWFERAVERPWRARLAARWFPASR